MKRNLLAALCVALMGVSTVIADDCCEATCGAANCCDTGCDTGCSDCGGSGCDACEATCGCEVDDCCEMDDCCEDECDDCCEDCCDDCCGVPGLVAGAEATYLRPDFQGDSFLFDFSRWEAAPRIWAGYENGCGRGIRARYWNLNAEDTGNLRVVEFDEIGDFFLLDLDGHAQVEAYTVDVELTRRSEFRKWDIMATLGARHANLDRQNDFNLFVDIDNGDPAIYLNADFGREFKGTGITGALEGRRKVGRGNFSFVWNARASYLWGEIEQTGDIGLAIIPIPFPGIEFEFSDEQDEEVFIGEAQAGLEWSRPVDCIEGLVFARTMVEYQTWDIDNSDSGIDLFNTSFGATDADFYGVTFAVGFER